ncbi:hypothetical protein ALI144C_07100 [Actinosynnema sp. ALI-1.44]|uniref:hypothetical protein n=1 Tax=Actinosynnema sp. ALI-1.44 TaxID=1933779 RepID=UPI00097BEFA2|nr:hypothetical protein [Actinosynnema sp. ALI-1.44]ONI88211.1 hypothetical protein ALI144C_07100 [Actinosynnema sp. ALI-1.44]
MIGNDAARPGESDVDLEQRLGTRSALYTLWNPHGRPVTVSWDDSNIITADKQTRARLVQVHLVIHSLLRGQHIEAMDRLSTMSGLMAAFTALRSFTLVSEALWDAAEATWRDVLDVARTSLDGMVARLPSAAVKQVLTGADAMSGAAWQNIADGGRDTVLDCVAGTAATLSPNERNGLGGFGAAVYSTTLRAAFGRADEPQTKEHAALLAAMALGKTVTHRDGRLLVDS